MKKNLHNYGEIFAPEFSNHELFGDRLFNALEKNDPTVGSLLVASPDMVDETFSRSVIYLMQHDENISVGVIMNQQSEVSVHSVLPDWSPFCSAPASFFVGGPDQSQTAMALLRLKPGESCDDPALVQHIEGRSYLVNLEASVGPLAPHVESLRIYAGFCSWAPGQLQQELDAGDWYVTPSVTEDFGHHHSVDLYAQVLRRQEMPLRLYASHPVDPGMN